MNAARTAVFAVSAALVLTTGCTLARRAPATSPPPTAVLAALAAREDANRDLCVSMRLRTGGSPLGALVTSPAYLAISDPEHLRLQVLSPFGVTVADLTIAEDRYELSLPLRNERTAGAIDPNRLTSTGAASPDRMLIALALLFRPRTRRGGCTVAGATATCPLGDLTVEISVDEAFRPVRERFLTPDGTSVLETEYGDYDEDTRGIVPGRIAIDDRLGGASMAGKVTSVRACQRPPARLDRTS